MQKSEPRRNEFEIFQSIRPKLYRYAISILGNHADAEDALQEASLKVWRHIGQVAEVSSISSWLYQVVVNTCRDHLRRKKRFPLPIHTKTESAPSHDEYWVEFEAMVSHLSERQQEIIVLRFGLDFTFKEIADAISLPESTVKYQLVKAVENLRSIYLPGEEADCNEM
ncbi:RNA polymerase sigma factor [Dethiobacter alkaliphilus]|uniref:RNA polymerase, sigma-24 subunit, ECF subfamily n=1 Tax=Dethiobacter alkaliphilus AHT 1 TaxID=555088 RepID=C0GD82_DETAL|nr:RNA polymerase sigma factor [Dethiobacter alkaliphilus]EEG78603.1 RNA polymerase, sigma-24 subunit, ECF subfamily [Dethiobacter alkaliphilus AHT 1]